jgi:hypothetical protein
MEKILVHGLSNRVIGFDDILVFEAIRPHLPRIVGCHRMTGVQKTDPERGTMPGINPRCIGDTKKSNAKSLAHFIY